MTGNGEDVQRRMASCGDVWQQLSDSGGLQHSNSDESLQQQPFVETEHHDLFGGPGFEINLDAPDDRSVLSGEHGPDDLVDLAEAPQRLAPGDMTARASNDASPTLAREQHDAIFARCLLSNCDFSGLKMPWEVGIFRDIFSDEPVPQQLVPAMEISADCQFSFGVEPQTVAERVAETASCTSAHPIFASCVSRTDGKMYAERRADLRDAAVSKLIVVLKHHC